MRKLLRSAVDRLIQGNRYISRIADLERKLSINSSLLMNYAPEVIPFNSDQVQLIQTFRETHDLADFNTSVSKEDIMFLFQLYYTTNADVTGALEQYFERGNLAYKTIGPIIDRLLLDPKTIKVLDFACGHGCVLRFLPLLFPKENIYASDIKGNAVDFCAREFGVNTFLSTMEPESLHVQTRFDFIFVSSLFTHLPKKLFNNWLRKLYSMLTPEGTMLFSVHSTRLLNGRAKGSDFHYGPGSEEKIFATGKDAIKDDSAYGETYVSNDYLREIFKAMQIPETHYILYGKVYWIQDLVLVSKRSLENLK